MFDKNGISVLKIGEECSTDAEPVSNFNLKEGERIVGIESKLYSAEYKNHLNLTFIIGWLE